MHDKDRIKQLEDRVKELEQQMTTCLRWMRKHAEMEVEKRDPAFKAKALPSS